MKIYTNYFGNMRHIYDKEKDNICFISICGKAPFWYKGIEYKKLAPKWSFFQGWKETRDNDYYIKHFQEEVLDTLDKNNVIKDLSQLSQGKDIVLLCYEKPNDFCHRHLVAEWLNKNVEEYKGE